MPTRLEFMEYHEARRQRWQAVHDRLAAAGVESKSGRGNEVLLSLEEWEALAERLPVPVPEHEAHTVDGPAECPRCQLLRDNAHWMATAVPAHRWGYGPHEWPFIPARPSHDTCSCGAERDTDKYGRTTYSYPAEGKSVEVTRPEINTRQDGVHLARPGSAGSMYHCAVCHEAIKRARGVSTEMIWVHVATGAASGVGADPDVPAE